MKIVIKIGSSNLIKNSNVDKEKLEKLSEVLFKYRDKHDFVIVSSTINADKMIILSDVEGLYDKNPKIYKNSRLIPEVHEITDIILKNSGGAGSNFGTGGMKTKIDAAQICMKSGIDMYIIKGDNINNLRNILEGKSVGTRFFPENKEEANKKMWIAYGRRENGKLIVDNGASKALCNGKSLLATGVKKVIGDFKVGHMVRIYDENNNEIARGLSNYTKKEMKKIKGKKSSEIEKILGYKYQDEVIHRNNMLII